MTDESVNNIIKIWETHKTRKEQWHSHWEDLARVLLTRRMGFVEGGVSGETRTDELFDGTPAFSARSLANNVGFFLRPENQKWIFMRAEDDALNEDDDAKFWLRDAQDKLVNALYSPKARFRQATGEVDMDLVVFGTGVMFVGESNSMDHLLFQSLHLKDVVVVYDEEGSPHMLFHKRTMTIRQAMQKFGEEKLSQGIQEKIQQDRTEDKIELLRAVMPREDSKPNPVLAVNMPFKDLWIELDGKHKITEQGFMEFPFVAPRWDTTSGEDYGRSPGMIALPDSNTLQAMGETILVSGQRAADPPLAAPNDGSFDQVNTFPGGMTYYDVETATSLGGNPFFPLQSGVNLPITRDMQLDTRNQVMAAFFRNILNLPVDGPQMTATEVIQRKDEFIREVGPVFGRLETDYTAPMVERAFMVMLRAGGFAPIPESLQGRNIKFEFESPISKIRQQVEAAAVRLVSQEALELAGASQDMSILDNIDFDEVVRFSADANAIPNRVLRRREDVERIRQERQQAQQAQQMAAAMQQGAEIAEKGSKAAKNLGIQIPDAEQVGA